MTPTSIKASLYGAIGYVKFPHPFREGFCYTVNRVCVGVFTRFLVSAKPSFAHSGSQCLFNCPAKHIKTLPDQSGGKTGNIGPIRQASPLATKLDKCSVALVSCLLGEGSPHAVVRGISFVVIDTLKGVPAFWTRAYVGDEVRKRSAPSWTYDNPAPAIPAKAGVVGIAAAVQHTGINNIFRSLGGSMRFLERSWAALTAAAASLLRPRQASRGKDFLRSALATYSPVSAMLPFRVWHSGNNSPFSVGFVYHGFDSVMKRITIH